jgi:hypothetical protein
LSRWLGEAEIRWALTAQPNPSVLGVVCGLCRVTRLIPSVPQTPVAAHPHGP